MALAPTNLTDIARSTINLDPKMVPMIIQGIISPSLLAQMDNHLCDAAQFDCVDDATDYQLALDVASRLKGDVKIIEEYLKPMVDTLYFMHRAATTRRGELTASATAAAKRLESLATAWHVAEEGLKRREAAEIQRQIDEKAAAARREADRIAQEAADKLAQEGRHIEAEAVIYQRAEEAAMEAQAPVMQVLAAPVLPAGVKPPAAQRVTWKVRVDKAALIRAAAESEYLSGFLLVDEAALNRLAASQKGEMRVPGCIVYSEASTVTRAAR